MKGSWPGRHPPEEGRGTLLCQPGEVELLQLHDAALVQYEAVLVRAGVGTKLVVVIVVGAREICSNRF